jgi:hypothetical protein
MPYTEQRLIERVAANYWRHFSVPMTISEVATSGSVERRLNWLHRSVEQVGNVRAAGVPVCGYTWWPMFALVTWAWRQGRRDIADHLLQMGLWNLDAGLQRIHTPLVEAYRTLVERGAEPVGALSRRDKSISEGEDHVPQLLSGRV